MIHIVKAIRQRRADRRWFESIKKNRSRLDPDQACQYTEYLKTCQQAFQEPLNLLPSITEPVNEFNEKGFTSWWDEDNHQLAQAMLDKIRQEEQSGQPVWDESGRYLGDLYKRFPEIEQLFQKSLGQFLRGVYRAQYKIFYGLLYKSERKAEAPSGSQLWHADGGPGTCINAMFVLNDLAREDGAIELLPWSFTEKIFSKERPEVPSRIEAAQKKDPSMSRLAQRKIRTDFFRQQIEAYCKDRIEQPVGRAGLIIPFRNNVLHKGGFPEEGRVRYACVFHVYPSHKPTDWQRYRTRGVPKTGPYPEDPSSDF